ncbi:MAG: YfiR family protein [Bdellovibrionota bacterium]
MRAISKESCRAEAPQRRYFSRSFIERHSRAFISKAGDMPVANMTASKSSFTGNNVRNRFSAKLSPRSEIRRSVAGHRRRVCVLVSAVFYFLVVIAPSSALADTVEDRSGKIRAALVYYLVKFVSLPEASSGSTQSSSEDASAGSPSNGPGAPISLCVVGSDPLNGFIADTVRGKSARGKKIRVTFAERGSSVLLQQCNVVFVGSDVLTNDRGFVEQLKNHPLLSVCSVERVQWGNCVMQLFAESNRARIAVDLPLAHRLGLKIDSELLEVAVLRE